MHKDKDLWDLCSRIHYKMWKKKTFLKVNAKLKKWDITEKQKNVCYQQWLLFFFSYEFVESFWRMIYIFSFTLKGWHLEDVFFLVETSHIKLYAIKCWNMLHLWKYISLHIGVILKWFLINIKKIQNNSEKRITQYCFVQVLSYEIIEFVQLYLTSFALK